MTPIVSAPAPAPAHAHTCPSPLASRLTPHALRLTPLTSRLTPAAPAYPRTPDPVPACRHARVRQGGREGGSAGLINAAAGVDGGRSPLDGGWWRRLVVLDSR
ncbi:hypothetical protein DENSPDRAFT_845238 [Dentipellis sp. KUC8613]|nr:hypothetical protein DENSPDRAFT_845238 [Dentipellis sp. KUC8613]